VVKHHVDVLVRQGLLRRERGSRGLLPTRPTGLPLRGPVAAGAPLDVFESGDVDLLELEAFIPPLPGTQQTFQLGVFALLVRGDSMIEDGILDGDYALIAPSPTVAPGAIAVALHRSANGGLAR
jgi:repressor LexA